MKPGAGLRVGSGIEIPISEIEFSYARSSGPGGQNVNKVNSKAVLRWNPGSSRAFSEEIRRRVLEKLKNQLTRGGDLVISSDQFRDQGRNRESCLSRLGDLIASVARKPKLRIEGRPTRAARRKARESKIRHSEKKRLRRELND